MDKDLINNSRFFKEVKGKDLLRFTVLFLVMAFLVFFTISAISYSHSLEKVNNMITLAEELQEKRENGQVVDPISDMAILYTGDANQNKLKSDDIKLISVLVFNEETYRRRLILLKSNVFIGKDKDGDGKSLRDHYDSRKPKNFLKTVSNAIDLDVDHYITLGTREIISLVDSIEFITLPIFPEDVEMFNESQRKMAEKYGKRGYKEIQTDGWYQVTGLQAAAFVEMGTQNGNERQRRKNFRRLMRAILDSLRKCSVEDMMKVKRILYHGARSFSSDYILECAARVRAFRHRHPLDWPQKLKKYSYKGGKYLFLTTPSENAVILHESLGELDYKPSKTIKKQDVYTKAAIKKIIKLKKKKIAEKRAREEALRRAQEEAVRNSQTESPGQIQGNQSANNGGGSSSGNDKANDSGKKPKKPDGGNGGSGNESGGNSGGDSGGGNNDNPSPPEPEPQEQGNEDSDSED